MKNERKRIPETITPEDSLASAMVKMHKREFRRFPVVKDRNLSGIITDRESSRRVCDQLLAYCEQLRVATGDRVSSR